MLRSLAEQHRQSASASQLELTKNLNLNLSENSTHQDIKSSIREYEQSTCINQGQMLRLLHLCSSLEELQQILKKKTIYLNQITIAEYKLVIKIIEHPEKLYVSSQNHPLIIRENYEYGWQESPLCQDNKMYYLLFYDLMMLDIDDDHRSISERISVNEISPISNTDSEDKLKRIETVANELNLTVRVYTTYNGFHVFVTSQSIHHTNAQFLKECTLKFGADVYYRLFSERTGYKVRLNRKLNRSEQCVAKYLIKFGEQSEDPGLLSLLQIHDEYLAKFDEEH